MAVAMAQNLAGNCAKPYLLLSVKIRKVVLSNLKGPRKVPIDDLTVWSQSEARMTALFKDLVRVYANNLILCDQLKQASDLLENHPQPDENKKTRMGRSVAFKTLLTRMRILHYQGWFKAARDCFHSVKAIEDCIGGREGLNATIRLAALDCELGKPDAAINHLISEINFKGRTNQLNLPYTKNLQLSLAEAYIKAERLEAAHKIYQSLDGSLPIDTESDFPTRMRNLRWRIGLAICSHDTAEYGQALDLWGQALEAAIGCGWQEGFIEMVIYYSMGDIKLQHPQHEDAEDLIIKANRLYGKHGIQHWFTGLGTYWLPLIMGRIRQVSFSP